MKSATTHGIRVSVESEFQIDQSNPIKNRYIHAYRIKIENLSEFTVQLLRRHWTIRDSNGYVKEVEGEGVIGEQPILKPGQTHQYSSWCPLSSEIGKMSGTYLMERQFDHHQFKVEIPEFSLIAQYVLN